MFKKAYLLSLLLLAACAPGFKVDPGPTATNIDSSICSASLKQSVFDELNRLSDEQIGYPDEQSVKESLSARLQEHWGNTLSRRGDDALAAVSDDVASVYAQVLKEAQAEPLKDGQDLHQSMLSALVQLEMGDSSTPERANLQTRMSARLAHARSLVVQLDSSCGGDNKPIPGPEPDGSTMLGHWQKTQVAPVYGAWKTMATAYQSCDVVKMDPLDSATPDAQGVTKILQSNGNYFRKFTDLNKFIATNPYYKSYRAPASSCVQVEKSPLVYDFGGKPTYATSTSPLNLFQDNGGGTPGVLGIDCSGFVTTAFMTAGLRLVSGITLPSSAAANTPARSYQNPSSAGLTCFTPISVSKEKTLMPGDVLASSGHVVMIDRVGSDPFGIAALTSASQCTSVNIDPKKFDFTVIQSSPVKGNIGIDRIEAAAFFPITEAAMRSALETYALAACKAKFSAAVTPSSSQATLVRHLDTDACVDTKAVALVSQECVSTCSAQ